MQHLFVRNVDIQLQTVVAAVFCEYEQGVYCSFSSDQPHYNILKTLCSVQKFCRYEPAHSSLSFYRCFDMDLDSNTNINSTVWVCVCSGEADLEQVKLSSRCSRADEEVFGEQETLALSFLPQRERAQADLTEHAPLAAGRQLDQRAWTWSRSEE